MNRYGELADELTEMIEEMERPAFRDRSASLVRCLQRAFNAACLLEREMRLAAAKPVVLSLRPKVSPPAGRLASVPVGDAGSPLRPTPRAEP